MSRVQLLIVLTATILLLSGSALGDRTPYPCSVCGETITGAHFETGGEYYHPEHFTCEYCGQPIKSAYTVYRKRNYHSHCFQTSVALRCSVCDGVIEGEYIIDYWGNATHVRHRDEVVRCDFCNRFIVGTLAADMVQLPGDRHLCGICSPSSITNPAEARRLMAAVSGYMSEFGLAVDPGVIELHLVDLGRLQKLSGKRSGSVTGFTDAESRKTIFGRTQHLSLKVYLLNGMPRVQMASTLAHELTHVWLFVQGRLRHDKALAEGSCNYVSYLVLQKMGGEQGEYITHNMMRDRDRIYGAGFRRVKRYVEKYGVAEWIRLLKKRDTMVSRF
ncbi:MAG: protein DA1 [Candidatus Krumholzibacteriia bacterium]